MASMDSLDTLFREELKDVYDAEKQITKALPKMIKKATHPELKQGMEQHLQQTQQQIERLEQIFEQLGMPARGKKCEGMKHLIGEGDDMIGDADEDATRDAVIIAAAQKVEHYEIASYGTLRTWAQQLGHDEVASLLEETLEEEKETDERLTQVAEQVVNREAADEGDEEEEEETGGRGKAQARGASRSGAGMASRARASRSRQTAADTARSRRSR